MDPNKPQYTIDYLDQIAPKQSSALGDNKLFFGVIGLGIIVVIVFAFALITGGSGPSQTSRIQTLAARLQSMQKIASDSQQNITNNHLQSINASLSIQLTNTKSAMVKPLGTTGVDTTKLPKDVQTTESLSDVSAKLADAKLNATFDRVYANEMNYELSDTFILMREIDNGTKNKTVKDFLVTTSNNLAPLQIQLSNFTDASS